MGSIFKPSMVRMDEWLLYFYNWCSFIVAFQKCLVIFDWPAAAAEVITLSVTWNERHFIWKWYFLCIDSTRKLFLTVVRLIIIRWTEREKPDNKTSKLFKLNFLWFFFSMHCFFVVASIAQYCKKMMIC